MSRAHIFFLITGLMLVGFVSHSILAQEEIQVSPSNETQPPSLPAFLLGDSMPAQLTELATKVMDGYLDYFAQPETAKKLATFQKNYYDALIEKGFTKEQAFELVLRHGNPLADTVKASN